jgi:GxxExxY protein
MKTQEPAENAELYNHELNRRVIGCAIEVHRNLGPGLLESAYQQCLAHEMHLAGLSFKAQHPVPVYYKGVNLDCGYRLDFLVEDFLVIELKAVDSLISLHQAQLLTYMRLAEAPLGLLLNFNVKLLKDGIKKCAISNFSACSASSCVNPNIFKNGNL